jgi:hypothetical protein
MENVLRRLNALYHGSASLKFTGSRPHGVTAILILPASTDAHSASG